MRLRITFSKTDSLRYIGHLDLHQVWERTIRRAGLPLAYTQGFHPGPKMQIASALPLGFTGMAEVIDIWLNEEGLDASALDLLGRIQASAPPGLTLFSAEAVDERGPALQTQVRTAEYSLEFPEPSEAQDLPARVRALLSAGSLPRERRGKPYDLRPLIRSVEVINGSLKMVLEARAGATGRPEEVLEVLGIPAGSARITRLCLGFESDGK